MTEDEFQQLVEETISIYERFIPGAATATREMIVRRGVIQALLSLVQNANIQRGFRILRDNNMLNRTFEQLIVDNPEFFDTTTIECARFRLEHHGDL